MGEYHMVYRKFNKSIQMVFMVLTVMCAAVIIVSSLVPAQPSLNITNSDKVFHTLAYFSLASVALPAFPRTQPWLVWLGLCGLGICIELAQGLMNLGRSADMLDEVANASGALFAVIAWIIVSMLVRKLMR